MIRYQFVYVATALAIAACGSDSAGPSVNQVAALAMVIQPSEQGASGKALERQPIVELRDSRGSVVRLSGVLVSIAVTSGGGSLVGTAAVRTDTDGRATFTNLGIAGPVGPKTLRFEASGIAGVTANSISLVAGDPTTITVAAGGNQVVPAGSEPPTLPSILVSDGAGNPVPGVAVTFSVTGGGGVLTNPKSVTGNDGLATPGGWVLGTLTGINTLLATLDAFPALSVSISVTATVGPPARILLVEGGDQTATIGTNVAVAPAVKVTDAFDNLVGGVTITFTPSSGGGTGESQTAISNSEGIARVPFWRLSFVPGVNQLVASREGAEPLTITANGVSFLVVALSSGGFSSCAITTDGGGGGGGASTRLITGGGGGGASISEETIG